MNPEQVPVPEPEALPPLTYRDLLHALAGADDHLLDLPVVMSIVVAEDTPAGSTMLLPVGSLQVLNEPIYETADGLCNSSQLSPEEWHAGLPVVFQKGHPVLTNVGESLPADEPGYDPEDTY